MQDDEREPSCSRAVLRLGQRRAAGGPHTAGPPRQTPMSKLLVAHDRRRFDWHFRHRTAVQACGRWAPGAGGWPAPQALATLSHPACGGGLRRICLSLNPAFDSLPALAATFPGGTSSNQRPLQSRSRAGIDPCLRVSTVSTFPQPAARAQARASAAATAPAAAAPRSGSARRRTAQPRAQRAAAAALAAAAAIARVPAAPLAPPLPSRSGGHRPTGPAAAAAAAPAAAAPPDPAPPAR
jgi:hypothetical protein